MGHHHSGPKPGRRADSEVRPADASHAGLGGDVRLIGWPSVPGCLPTGEVERGRELG